MPTDETPRVWNKRDPNKPKGAVYVGRPTKWGNPFTIGQPNSDDCMVGSREDCVAKYRSELLTFRGGFVWVTVDDVRRELRGKHLVCWCSPLPCHADVLLEIANAD